MKHRGDKKPYFLLAEPVAVDDQLLNSLLGLAVEDLEDPNWGTKAYARLERVVRLSLERDGSQQIDLAAAHFRRINMVDAPTNIETLLGAVPLESTNSTQPGNQTAADLPVAASPSPQVAPKSGLLSRFNPFKAPAPSLAPSSSPNGEASHKAEQENARANYQREVLTLLDQQEDGQLGIIVSFITCSDLTKNKDSSKGTSVGLEVNTGPVSEPVDVAVGGQYSSTHDVGVHGAYQGEYLIACSYLTLYKKPGSAVIPWLNKVFNWGLSDEETWGIKDKKPKGHIDAPLAGNNEDTEEPAETLSSKEEEDYGFLMICHDSEGGKDGNETDNEGSEKI
ncbi:hypothetical protein NM208_g3631 [Fusarium decemcellulare]|uniref:Uncharacterized protein n=1 Tax=Fusarium decemcellulare TaxID=57161 RepID=A0ACC1SNC5_9HYPO|nr:hypothetical protein NM208_g3631 [Fusarium decemcellulare]